MGTIKVRVAKQQQRIWLWKAFRLLKEKGIEITFDNLLEEISEFENMYIMTGLSKRDIEDLKETYEEIKSEMEM